MQRVVRSKVFIFEGEPPEGAAVLENWGVLTKRDKISIFTIESGEIRVKKIREDITSVVRRIYIKPACGCLLTLEEIRDFENETVTYLVVDKKLCPSHQT